MKSLTTILAIESSCDETSIAVIENGISIKSNKISSQMKAHQAFGGVVPELASRMHAEKIHILLNQALKEAGIAIQDIDAVAVTAGPGLEGSLLVGLTMAKTIAVMLDKPFLAVNHLHGHIYANFLTGTPPVFPFVCVLVSGGHTMLVLVKNHFDFQFLGSTRDDAAGEVFDKVARVLDLGYPGGPIVEKQASEGNPKAFNFPKAMKHRGYEFSFSGVKTAVIQQIRDLQAQGAALPVPDLCASFQKAVIDILLLKALKACDEFQVKGILLSGGVTANKTLRQAFQDACDKRGYHLYVPPFVLCTDNAAMIGAAAYFQYQTFGTASPLTTRANPNLPICSLEQ